MWVLRRGSEVILVDTGYDDAEAKARGRPIRMDPTEALRPLGLTADAITHVIVTHLHYDPRRRLASLCKCTTSSASGRNGLCDGPLHVSRHLAHALYGRTHLHRRKAAARGQTFIL